MSNSIPTAPGSPGIEPRWTSSAKDGIGTAYSGNAPLWFTLSHGIVNEIYFPHVDTPNTRDIEFLITDGATFCHEEKRDLDHLIEYPEKNAFLHRITNTEREGRYRIVKEILVEPESPVLLVNTQLEIIDRSLVGKLRVFVLLAPHLNGTGKNNSAKSHQLGGRKLLRAWRDDIHLVLGSSPDFLKRSVGFVGTSDGWQDLMDNRQMDWEYDSAEDGNIALTGEINLRAGLNFTVAVAFGFTAQSASTRFLQAVATPFPQQRERFVAQWKSVKEPTNITGYSGDIVAMIRLSHCVLLAHEDKMFRGAFVASLSIPWGEAKDDRDRGGYHLVWTRDLVQTATALLACGETEAPLRALIWLACVQDREGGLPQNSSITGEAYWNGIQLDEVAAPILLAWRLKESKALRLFDPWTIVERAARNLILTGPVTAQERWEENAGYSPSTLATLIAALVCAAEFAREKANDSAADFLVAYADWLNAHVEDWTVTKQGELYSDIACHYVRITPADPANPVASAAPDSAMITIANGGGVHPARNIVSGDFLQLVRLGIRDASDPLILASLTVIDRMLKRDLPEGPAWRRYNFDGYGQKADGGAFDGTGVGRSWPILTGERGHYELAVGRDPLPFLTTMQSFANGGGMMPEQTWDVADLENGRMKLGRPSGSAMPLCWTHAEFLTLAYSRSLGSPVDRPTPVYNRYVKGKSPSGLEMWTFARQPESIVEGMVLRIITAAPAKIRWSTDEWRTPMESEAQSTGGLDCWWADLPTQSLPLGGKVVFTFRWERKWEERNFAVMIAPTSR